MPVSQSVQNNFTKGLLTEFSGLNFPENAATDTENCNYSIIGDVTRRAGFNYETNFALHNVNRTSKAINTYKWNNVGGDGLTQLIVKQVGGTLYFYKSSAATILNPISTQILVSTVDASSFVVTGGSFDATVECQFTDGNGYLFVYHPNCDTFFCSYNAGTITASIITIQIRDFVGVSEPSVPVNTRPSSLTNDHLYNLTNQGWTQGNPWSALASNALVISVGTKVFTVSAGLGVSLGDFVNISCTLPITPGGQPTVPAGTVFMSGSVNSYSGNNLSVNVTSAYDPTGGEVVDHFSIVPINHGYINTWLAAEGNYPSNADVWWRFKDTNDVFNPAIMQPSVSLNIGPAPKGHYVLNAFSQTRGLTSGLSGLTNVTTPLRAKTGTWFQGRVWYTGVDAQQVATGDAAYYTWTENIYFSQVVTTSTDFGNCYQTNDPTSQTLFDLLPTDGGVIQIQGCGSIYKLFPIQNGMLVFAANGIWFITGSQGIGFSANDYTITKISSIQSISSTSFVNVNGLPYFWNEEGIYSVTPAQQGGLTVEPLTVGTILSFYNSIPVQSKKYARGDYNPIDYIIQWTYKSSNETSVTNRYDLDSVLNYNTFNKAFFPYSLPAITGKPHIHGINYVAGPGGSTSPAPAFKYITSASDGLGSSNFTFSEEKDLTYTDFKSFDGTGFDFTSYFVTGYRLAGKALLKFQPVYVYMYNNNAVPTQYQIQGLWDFANNRNSGRYSTLQLVTNTLQYAGVQFRKHRIRGRGMSLQIKVTSVSGQPFDIIGWASWEQMNAGI